MRRRKVGPVTVTARDGGTHLHVGGLLLRQGLDRLQLLRLFNSWSSGRSTARGIPLIGAARAAIVIEGVQTAGRGGPLERALVVSGNSGGCTLHGRHRTRRSIAAWKCPVLVLLGLKKKSHGQLSPRSGGRLSLVQIVNVLSVCLDLKRRGGENAMSDLIEDWDQCGQSGASDDKEEQRSVEKMRWR